MQLVSNPDQEVSGDLNKKEMQKELVSVEGNDIESDSSCSDKEEGDYIYDIVWEVITCNMCQ